MLSDAIALVRLSYLVCKWTLLYHKVVTIKLHDLGYAAASCSSANACQHTPCLPLFAYSHSQYGTRLVQCSGSAVGNWSHTGGTPPLVQLYRKQGVYLNLLGGLSILCSMYPGQSSVVDRALHDEFGFFSVQCPQLLSWVACPDLARRNCCVGGYQTACCYHRTFLDLQPSQTDFGDR